MTQENTRGVLYIVWDGDAESPRMLQRSLDSLKQHHPDLPVEVVRLSESATLLDKAKMLDLSPFDTTLFLDADTVVMGDLTFGFEKSEQHGVACCVCECPWARRYLGLQHCGDIVEYNTGVIFFTKRMKPLFDEWQRQNQQLNSAHYFLCGDGLEKCMPLNDQAGFAKAVENMETNPFVLPLNWNFRQNWHRGMFGPIKIWHNMSPVSDPVQTWNSRQLSQDRIDYGVLQFEEPSLCH